MAQAADKHTNLCSTAGRPRVPRERHTSPEVQRRAQGVERNPHKFCDARAQVWGAEKVPCKPLPSKHQPAVQGRTSVKKLQQKFKGTSRDLAAVRIC